MVSVVLVGCVWWFEVGGLVLVIVCDGEFVDLLVYVVMLVELLDCCDVVSVVCYVLGVVFGLV